jgi:CheY-like chemotaxis protein
MRTLLLADDNLTVQRVIALTFAREPITVVTASDGRQAMDRISSARPDIVLAATSLPQVSGYDLARYVRSHSELQHIPVLVLSGAFENVDEAELAASGAIGVIEKPVEPAVVISRVNDLLGLGTTGAPTAASSPAIHPNGAAESKMPAAALPRVVTSTHPIPPRQEEPVADGDYRDSLDEAFDILDEQLDGRQPMGEPPPTARPATAGPEYGNPVYEVDEEWFGDGGSARADARAGRRLDSSSPELAGTESGPPVYEIDVEWFAEDDTARASRTLEHEQLAKEMGLDEVMLPERPAPPMPPASPASPPPVPAAAVPAPPSEPEAQPQHEQAAELIDFAHLSAPELAQPASSPAVSPPDNPGFTIEPVARPLPIALFLGTDNSKAAGNREAQRDQSEAAFGGYPTPPEALHVLPLPPHAPATGVLADDFEALLAFEQGENAAPPTAMPLVHTVAPAITGAMLDQISTTVADRLKASVRVEAPPPQITDEMLADLARRVADRLAPNVRVEPAVPEFTNEMLDRIAGHVGERVQAGFTRDQLREAFGESIRRTVGEMVRQVVSETSERLVREEIERIKAQAQQS